MRREENMYEEKINLKDFLYNNVLSVLNSYDYDDIYTIIFLRMNIIPARCM